MAYVTTVSVSPEFYKICKDNHISLSEAVRVGISIMLAERDIGEYNNNLNIVRKMLHYKQTAEEALQKLAAIDNGNR
jgi:hypothetical protein